MVKIRYAELRAGLHVAAEERAGCTVVYLQPGLTPAQRRAALTFARRSARIGHGPRLPVIDMAFALAADRARTSGRTVVAVLRQHPSLLLPIVAAVSGVIVVTMLSFVTVSPAPFRFPGTDPTFHGTGGPAKSAGPASGGPAAASPHQASPHQTNPQQSSPQQPSPQPTGQQQPSPQPTSRPYSTPRQAGQQQNSQQDASQSATPTPVSEPMSLWWEYGYLGVPGSPSDTPSPSDAAAAAVRVLCMTAGPTSTCLRL